MIRNVENIHIATYLFGVMPVPTDGRGSEIFETHFYTRGIQKVNFPHQEKIKNNKKFKMSKKYLFTFAKYLFFHTISIPFQTFLVPK